MRQSFAVLKNCFSSFIPIFGNVLFHFKAASLVTLLKPLFREGMHGSPLLISLWSYSYLFALYKPEDEFWDEQKWHFCVIWILSNVTPFSFYIWVICFLKKKNVQEIFQEILSVFNLILHWKLDCTILFVDRI